MVVCRPSSNRRITIAYYNLTSSFLARGRGEVLLQGFLLSRFVCDARYSRDPQVGRSKRGRNAGEAAPRPRQHFFLSSSGA